MHKSNLLPQRKLRERLGGISDMTVSRWRASGILPPPVVICGRNYWPEPVVDELAAKGAPRRAQQAAQ